MVILHQLASVWYCSSSGIYVPSCSYAKRFIPRKDRPIGLVVSVNHSFEAVLRTYLFYRGITVVIGSTVSIMVALAWAGAQFPWSSVHVLVPLVLGATGMIAFFVIERTCSWIREPTVSSGSPITTCTD